MRILLTNDDGINAAGLKVLQEIAAKLSDDVWVVAPDSNQSGAAHSLTLQEPLRCSEIAPKTYSVKGTPTDCVIMGVRHILKDDPPALILSGVNHGSNLGEDITYSGTVAGAMEGTLLGIPSIALSLTFEGDKNGDAYWDTPLAFGPQVIQKILDADVPDNTLFNINFPPLAPNQVQETTLTIQGRRDQNLLHIDERADTWGLPYYWFGFERRRSNPPEGTDLWAMYSGRISVTPLTLDLTNHEAARNLSGIFSE